jgi:hypothetical protein
MRTTHHPLPQEVQKRLDFTLQSLCDVWGLDYKKVFLKTPRREYLTYRMMFLLATFEALESLGVRKIDLAMKISRDHSIITYYRKIIEGFKTHYYWVREDYRKILEFTIELNKEKKTMSLGAEYSDLRKKHEALKTDYENLIAKIQKIRTLQIADKKEVQSSEADFELSILEEQLDKEIQLLTTNK